MKELLAKRHENERRDRIDSILQASRKLFLKKGYAATTMRDICEACSLSTGAVYFYFSGKDELYAKICEESFHVLLEMLEKSIMKSRPADERMHALTAAYVRFYLKHTDRWIMLSSGFRNAGLAEHLLAGLEALEARALALAQSTVHDMLEEKKISEKHPSREAMLLVWAGIEGLLNLHYQGHLDARDKKLEDLAALQLDIVLQGFQ